MPPHALEDGVGHAYAARHGVGVGEHRALASVEPLRQRPPRDRVDLLLAQALLEREREVRAVFVIGAVEQRDPQDGELAVAAAQLGLLADRGEELEPALGDWRAVEQRLVQVQELAAALGLDGRDELRELGMRLVVDQRYARQSG